MSFLDKMKKKAEELELDKKAKDLQAAATAAAKQAREKAGDYTAENRHKIDGYVEKAATTIDAKTDGKYADKVAKAKVQVAKGVDKVAEGKPERPLPQTDSAPEATFPVDPDAPRPPTTDTPGDTSPRPYGT